MKSCDAPPVPNPFWVYILRCADGTFYTGMALDVDRRAAVHNRGQGAKYTRRRLPADVVFREACADKGAALRREHEIKKMSRPEKMRLIAQFMPNE